MSSQIPQRAVGGLVAETARPANQRCYKGCVRTRRVVLALVACAVVGIGVSGLLASRAVTLEEAPASEALRRFEEIRAALGRREPLIGLDEAGNVIRRASPPLTTPRRVTRLGVIAYQAGEQRLVSADVPMWFFWSE